METLENNVFYSLIFDEECQANITKINENIFMNKEYFKKMKELYNNNELELAKLLAYNEELTTIIISNNFTSATFESSLNELNKEYNKKVLKARLQKAISDLNKGDEIEKVISYINKDKDLITNDDTIKNATEISVETFDYIEKSYNEPKLITGLVPLDNILGGIQKGNLVILSARASSGKTTFALQTALNMAMKKNKVLFISLEMSVAELGIKIYSRLAEVDSREILNRPKGVLNKNLTDEMKKFNVLNFNIDDKTQYIEDIVANIRLLKAKKQVDVVFIDYIGLIKTREKAFSRENEVARISRELKLVAKECNVAIILLAQLNRLAENQEPTLAMLRESGSLEQDANKVIFLYQEQQEQEKLKGKLNIKVAKNREGTKGTIQVGFLKTIGKIGELKEKQNESNK